MNISTQNNNINLRGWAPLKYRKTFSDVAKLIQSETVQKIAVSGHRMPDADCICSSIALGNMINKSTGKKVDVFVFGDIPQKYNRFSCNKNVTLVPILSTKTFNKENLLKKFGLYDLAISVDTAVTNLISNNYLEGIFKKAKRTVKIDHHPNCPKFTQEITEDNKINYADINIIDDRMDSNTQLIMQFAKVLGLKPKDVKGTISECIYTGLIADTNNFAFSKSSNTFIDASLLIKNGVNGKEIYDLFFRNTPIEILEIRKYLYSNIKFSTDGKIAFIEEDKTLRLLKEKANVNNLRNEVKTEIDNFLQELLKISNVEIAFKVSNGTNFCVRSKNIDITSIAEKFGGGGHNNATAFVFKKSNFGQENLTEKVLSEYQKLIMYNDLFS